MYKTLHKKQGSVTVQLRFARSSVTFCAKRDISHNKSKDIPHSGACEKDLPAQRHGEVLDGLLQPQGDDLVAGVHEEAGGDKAHHRAHQAYDHGRDR